MITFEKSAGVVTFRQKEGVVFFLLLKYRNGHWDFPKGHIEKGETEKEAALRELDEETEIRDIDVMEGFRKNIYYFFRAKGAEREERKEAGQKINIFKKVTFFLGETKEEKVVVSDRQVDHVWLPYQEAIKKATHRNAINLLKLANQYLKNK